MRVLLEGEQQLCPCYKECQEFQKLVELRDSGLAVYCHRPRKEAMRQAEEVENTSRDVFILHNKKDVKIATSELTSELETKNISCPRCRKTFEQAEKLMQEVKSIDRKIVMGICDHCRKKAITAAKTIKKPFCACDDIVKKFISVKGEQKEDIKKYVKIWLSKMGHLLKDDITLNQPKKIKTRTYSDLQINQDLNSPASRHEPEIQQLFDSGTHKPDINFLIKTTETNLIESVMKQAVPFFQPIEHVEITFPHTPHEIEKKNAMIPSASLEASDTTLMETYIKELPRTSLKDRKQEEVFEDIPSMDAKEALKRRHDISLRQMMRLEKDSRVPHSVSKRPDIYETPKIAPWEQKELISKYHVKSEMDIKTPPLKHDRGPRGTSDLDYVSNREVKFRSPRASQDSYYKPKKADKYNHDKVKQGLYVSEVGQKKVNKLKDRYIMNEELKLQRSVDNIIHKAIISDQHVAKSKSWHKKVLEPKESEEFILKPQYSFYFPKLMDKEAKQVEVDVSSSHLIKDTQEKFRLQAESDMKRREEERQQKLEEDQIKKLAREEKKKQAEEEKEAAEYKKRQQDKSKRDKTKGDTFDKDGEIFSESEQKGKISKQFGGAKKDTKPERIIDEEWDQAKIGKKPKPQQGDKIDEILQKARPEKGDKITELLQKAEKDLESKPEQGDKIHTVLQKAKTDIKPEHRTDKEFDEAKIGKTLKPEQRDKIDTVLQKAKRDIKPEHRTDEELDEAKIGKKLKPEQGNKIDKVLQKAKKDLKSKPEQQGKIAELLQKAKKDLQDKPEKRDKIDTVLQRAKKSTKSEHRIDEELDEAKIGIKSKPQQGDKVDEVLQKARPEKRDKITELSQRAKKDTKSEHRIVEEFDETKIETKSKLKQGDKIDKALQRAKKYTKSEHTIDEELDKAKIGTKSKPKQGDKIDKVLQKAIPGKGDEIAELLQKAKKDLKSKSGKRYDIDEVLEKTKENVKKKSELKEKGDDEVRDKGKKDLKETLTQKGKDDDLISKAMKEQKTKRETREKYDETIEQGKKGLKEKPELTEKGRKEIKSGIEQNNKISISEKPKKDLKATSEQDYKGVEKEQKTKTEKQNLDEKLQNETEYKERLKQIEQLRKEKEALKKQADSEKEEVSKVMKSPKKKRDSSKEIKVSISKIQKSMKDRGKDESENKLVFFVKKQEEKKKEEENQKEFKPSPQELEFKKLQAQHLKAKEEALKKKKQLEHEAEVAKALEEAERKSKTVELKMADINMKTDFSKDKLILKLIRIKQASTMKPSDIDVEIIKAHKCHHGRRTSVCPLCVNSELELDVLSLDNKINLPKEIISDIIIGEKICKIKRRLEKTKEPEVCLKLYRKIYFLESDKSPKEIVKIIPQEAEAPQKKILSKKDAEEIEMEPGKGVLRYALSDRTFIDKGWTMLPTEKVVRKMNVYRMRPAHPEFDWFEHNKNKRLMTYDTGERLAEFDDNGRGRWYYRSGRLALDYYDAEETNAQQRFVIYSSGEPNERGRTYPITILATFDYLGNGIVFDHTGKIRLKYNQTEGVVLDRGIGPVSHWKWHTLNDPPVLQQVMIDTQMAHKDPNILKLGSAADRATRPDNEEMLAIEFDNFIKEKSKKLSQKFKPFQIKMKALKINEHFSLKVLDQATVYLIFRDGTTNLKLNIGMILDHQEIVDTDTAEVGEVSNSLERFPARTDSLAGLQRSVAHAQRYERLQIERERRLRLPEPCASADQLTAAASPPLRLPLRTVPTGSCSTGYCRRKPAKNLYYNTRLL